MFFCEYFTVRGVYKVNSPMINGFDLSSKILCSNVIIMSRSSHERHVRMAKWRKVTTPEARLESEDGNVE